MARTRSLAITMNTIERVAELYLPERGLIPKAKECPDAISTYYNALQIVVEGLFRYGKLTLPMPSWHGKSKEKCEALLNHLHELGMPKNCLSPGDLINEYNINFSNSALNSLIEHGRNGNLQRAIWSRALLSPETQCNWRECIYRELIQYPCKNAKADLRTKYPGRYVPIERCELIDDFIPLEMTQSLSEYASGMNLIKGDNSAIHSRIREYIESSLIRAEQSKYIYKHANVDYYPFILHAFQDEIDNKRDRDNLCQRENKKDGFVRDSAVINGFLHSIFADLLIGIESDPDNLWRKLASMMNDPTVKKLQKDLALIDSNIDKLMIFEDAIKCGDNIFSGDQLDVIEPAAAVAAGMFKLVGGRIGIVLETLLACTVFVHRREKSISRKYSKFIHIHKTRYQKADLRSKFLELFKNKFSVD